MAQPDYNCLADRSFLRDKKSHSPTIRVVSLKIRTRIAVEVPVLRHRDPQLGRRSSSPCPDFTDASQPANHTDGAASSATATSNRINRSIIRPCLKLCSSHFSSPPLHSPKRQTFATTTLNRSGSEANGRT